MNTVAQEPEIQWQQCRKCGDWRSHYPVASYEIGKPPNWHCSLCGTVYKPPKKTKGTKREQRDVPVLP